MTLISKACLQSHKDYPPHRKEWSIHRSIEPSMLQWFLLIAGSLERLTAVKSDQNIDLLPALLAEAARTAPNLNILLLSGGNGIKIGMGEMKSLNFLSHIKRLELGDWCLTGDDAVFAEVEHLSGLQSLEVKNHLDYITQLQCSHLFLP